MTTGTALLGIPPEVAAAVVSGPLGAYLVQRLAKRADARDNRQAALDARDQMLWQRMQDENDRLEQEVAELRALLAEKNQPRGGQ